MRGTEEYGDSTDDTKAWAKPFNHIMVSKYKVELANKSQSHEYKKGQLYGKKSDLEAILKDKDSILDNNGAKVFIKTLSPKEKSEVIK